MRSRPSWECVILLLVICSALLWLPFGVIAQQVLRELTINSVDVTRLSNLRSQVKAYVTVTDLNGAPIKGLSASDFAVTEDGIDKPIASLESASEGVAIVLVLDTTSSMHEEGLKAAKEAADSFVSNTAPQDQVALYEFQEESNLLVDFTLDHNMVRNAIGKLQLVDRWTCLYDAASTAVKKAMQIPRGRRAVVLMTDGKDTRGDKPCSTSTVDDVITLAFKQRVPLYIVGLGPEVDESTLERVAEKTGGAYWRAPKPEDLSAAYHSIADLLQSQYVVTYESTAGTGEHGLQIRVNYQDQQALNAIPFVVTAPPPTPSPVATATAVPEPTATPPVVVASTKGLPWPILAAGGGLLLLVAAVLILRSRKSTRLEFQRETAGTAEVHGGGGSGEQGQTVDVTPGSGEDELTVDFSQPAGVQPLATLTVLSSLQLPEGESWDLYGRSITVGRSSDNEIVLPDQPVSRQHAKLRYEDDEFTLIDVGSKLGTFVNDVRVPPQGTRLSDGDRLQFGTRTVLRFTRLESAPRLDSTQGLASGGDATTEFESDQGTRDYSA